MRILSFITLLVLLSPAFCFALTEDPVRLDLRLTGSDLVDEMVHTWIRSPPFQGTASLIVAEVDAPIGIDQRFAEDLENHLYAVLRANPRLPLQLVHCSYCRQWVAVSSPKKTTIGSALNQPEAVEELRRYPHLHALSLHFDVVARDLVLWAEIYEVTAPQKVIWAQRFSVSTSARTVLREPQKLVSISEAREEQQKIFAGRDTLQAVTRFPIRTFSGADGLLVQPLFFLEQSFEAVLSPKKNRRVGLSVGLTSLKGSMQGWSFGTSFQQLLGRSEPSLTEPDLYLTAGVVFMRLEGPGVLTFSQQQLDVPRFLSANEDPRASLTAYQIGVEAHVKYRFGLKAFIEYIPGLNESRIIESRSLLIPYHSIGFAGVLLW